MRILLVNKFHWYKGGSETYYFELGNMLKSNGHEIAYFSMKNANNIKTGDIEFFVDEFDGNGKNIFKAFDTVYSKKNKEIMNYALETFKPDIVHVNLFQRHLTYSILEAVREHDIPIVYTAHDLQAVCPASTMLSDGKICKQCLNSNKFKCFKNKCIKNSRLKSLLSSIEATEYKNKKIYNWFDLIISPSDYVGEMIKKEGINTKIETIYNFVDTEKFNNDNNSDEGYAFFFGRLSVEKGILNLINAFSRQNNGYLYIAGEGPEKENILKYIKENNLEDRIKLLGFLSQSEVKKYISNCSFVVVPSIWYENCPYSILESLAMGKPVIGSKIGGIPELIVDGVNGYLFDYNDVDKLSSLISELFVDSELRNRMGIKSREFSESRYNMNNYYNNLMKKYVSLIKGEIKD